MKKIFLGFTIFWLFIGSLHANSIDEFWKWMKDNEVKLAEQYQSKDISAIVYEQLIKCKSGLAVIIPSYGGKKFEFVISANFNIKNVESIEELFKSKPKFSKIIVTKYLQPQMTYTNLSILQTEVPLNKIGIMVTKDGKKYQVTVFSGAFGSHTYEELINDIALYFQFLIGEEKVIRKISAIDIQNVSLVSPEIHSIMDLDRYLK